MSRDETGGSDYGRDDVRDLADEPPSSMRDTAPDIHAPIDMSSPVSGHVPAPEGHASMAESPEHDWAAAAPLLIPLLRPSGTPGMAVSSIDAEALAAQSSRNHAQPLVDEGPCGLAVVYAIPGVGFDIIVNGDHLLSWGVPVGAVQDAAMANLAAWSLTAPWTDEVSGERRLISSDTGAGWDASRILLNEVQDRLVGELGGTGRVLVGLPERHVLIAGALRPGDDEFADLFAEFVIESSGGADEPVDRRVFELVDGRLVEFRGLATPA